MGYDPKSAVTALGPWNAQAYQKIRKMRRQEALNLANHLFLEVSRSHRRSRRTKTTANTLSAKGGEGRLQPRSGCDRTSERDESTHACEQKRHSLNGERGRVQKCLRHTKTSSAALAACEWNCVYVSASVCTYVSVSG